MTDEDLETRIERIHDRTGPELTAEDLPEGYSDTLAYFTEDGWDYSRRNELLLAERGPADVASRALRDLEDLESNIETIETQFLTLYEAVFEGGEIAEGQKMLMEMHAERIRDGSGAIDSAEPSMIEGLRASLVALTEAAETE